MSVGSSHVPKKTGHSRFSGGLMVKATRVFRGLMAFLTAIPFKMDESFLDIAARYLYLFPVIGAIIGVLVGLYARFANNFLFLLFGAINNLVFSGAHEVFFEFAAKGLAAAMTFAFLLVEQIVDPSFPFPEDYS